MVWCMMGVIDDSNTILETVGRPEQGIAEVHRPLPFMADGRPKQADQANPRPRTQQTFVSWEELKKNGSLNWNAP